MMKKYQALLIAIVLGVVFASCVYDHETISRGWTIFCGLLTAGLLITVQGQMKHSRHGWLMIVSGLCIALSHGLYLQYHLTPINALVAPLMIIYGVRVLHFGHDRIEGMIKNYIKDFGRIFFSLKPAYEYSKSLFAKRFSSPTIPTPTNNTISGIMLSIGALVILIPVLSSVDQVFAKMFGGITTQLSNFFTSLSDFINTISIVDNLIIFCIVGVIVLSIMLYFTAAKQPKEVKSISRTIESAIYNIMTRSIAVVYVVFAFIQVKYLLLGAVLPEGITYSEYAVSGFWQLMCLSFVNIALMLLAPHYRKGQSKNTYIVLLRIVFISSMIIRLSSLLRLNLYIEAYGLTFMRILPLTFILYLGYGLIVSFAGIFYPRMQRSNLLIYGLVIWYVIFQLRGVDRVIANYNIERYINGKTKLIDVDYLTTDLSADQMKAKYNLNHLRGFLDIQNDRVDQIQKIDEYKQKIGQ